MTTKSDYKEDIERATAVFETNQSTLYSCIKKAGDMILSD